MLWVVWKPCSATLHSPRLLTSKRGFVSQVNRMVIVIEVKIQNQLHGKLCLLTKNMWCIHPTPTPDVVGSIVLGTESDNLQIKTRPFQKCLGGIAWTFYSLSPWDAQRHFCLKMINFSPFGNCLMRLSISPSSTLEARQSVLNSLAWPGFIAKRSKSLKFMWMRDLCMALGLYSNCHLRKGVSSWNWDPKSHLLCSPFAASRKACSLLS